MYAREVIEEGETAKSKRPYHVTRRNYLTRPITKYEKRYDLNRDGILQRDEMIYLKRAQQVLKQEKFLMGQP